MADDSLVDESHLPLRSVLPPINVQEILEGDILDLIGAKDLSDEKKNDMYVKMGHTIENRVIARIADSLSDEDMERFIDLSTSKPADAVEILKANEIDVPKYITEESLIYKTELVSLFQVK